MPQGLESEKKKVVFKEMGEGSKSNCRTSPFIFIPPELVNIYWKKKIVTN